MPTSCYSQRTRSKTTATTAWMGGTFRCTDSIEMYEYLTTLAYCPQYASVQACATLDAVGAILVAFLASYSVMGRKKTCPVISYNTDLHPLIQNHLNAHFRGNLHLCMKTGLM